MHPMKNDIELLSHVEKYMASLQISSEKNTGGLPGRQKHPTFDQSVRNLSFAEYVDSADYHYFVARVLFLQCVIEYSLFCSQQCVENYLKAYLSQLGIAPPSTHDLALLVEKCKENESDQSSFVFTTAMHVIVLKYNGFNEVPRYPLARFGIGSGYAAIWPDDICVLDYFVYQMRKAITIPETRWDILRNGHMRLGLCEDSFPDFYNLLKKDNINFAHRIHSA